MSLGELEEVMKYRYRQSLDWLNSYQPNGATIVDPNGKIWVVVEIGKVPGTYWAKHRRAWTLPTGVAPWVPPGHKEYDTRDTEDFAAEHGGAVHGDRDDQQQVLIPLSYVKEPEALPPEWGEVCF